MADFLPSDIRSAGQFLSRKSRLAEGQHINARQPPHPARPYDDGGGRVNNVGLSALRHADELDVVSPIAS
jgi:hypothetical protein